MGEGEATPRRVVQVSRKEWRHLGLDPGASEALGQMAGEVVVLRRDELAVDAALCTACGGPRLFRAGQCTGDPVPTVTGVVRIEAGTRCRGVVGPPPPKGLLGRVMDKLTALVAPPAEPLTPGRGPGAPGGGHYVVQQLGTNRRARRAEQAKRRRARS